MRQEARAGIIILVVLLLLSIGLAAAGFYYFQNERLKVIGLNKELEGLKAAKRAAENKLAQSKIRIDELNAQLASTEERVGQLSSQLETARDEAGQLNSQIEILQSQLREQEDMRQESESRAKREIEHLENLIRHARAGKAQTPAEADEAEAEKHVVLGRIIVGQDKQIELAQAQASPALQAGILLVNENYGFAVINLGSLDGVGVGEIFSVYKNGSYLGNVQVEVVENAISACGFISRDIKDKIKQGDKVILGKIATGQAEEGQSNQTQAAPASAERVSPQPASPRRALTGKVLTVNKNYGFAVINLGSRDGVVVGDIFSVYRNKRNIGEIQVEKVQEVMSACGFQSGRVKNKIRESDTVTRK